MIRDPLHRAPLRGLLSRGSSGRRGGTARSRSFLFLRQYKLGLLALLAFTALLLGLIGFLQANESLVDAAYATLSLLALNYVAPPNGDVHLTLQIARFMVPAVAAFATFTALVAVLNDQWHLARARVKSGHLIVCGLGRRGMRLVRSVLADDRPRGSNWPTSIVVIEADRTNSNVSLARELGAIVVIGDSTDPEILHAAGAHRAETLISVLPEDVDNAAVASGIRELCGGRTDSLDAYCHVTDMDLVEDLTSASLGSSDETLSLEWFSVPERAARLLLAEHGGLVRRSDDGAAPHLVVVGADDLARAVIVNGARQWHTLAGDGAEPLSMTVAGEGSAAWVRRLADRHPAVSHAARLSSYEHDLRSGARVDEARRALERATAVFVCAPTDTESLELGFAASRAVTSETTVVVRLLIENAGFVQLLEGEPGGGSLRLFSIVDRTCSIEMVTDGLNETLARGLHSVYLDQEAEGPAAVAWDQLEDSFKEANRAQARDVRNKLRSLGCRIRPLTDWDSPLLRLADDEVESLAEEEHRRWSRERKRQGWTQGSARDDQRRIHPLIDVPWQELKENHPGDADYDRDFVRNLPKVFAAAGYEMYRKGELSPSAQADREHPADAVDRFRPARS